MSGKEAHDSVELDSVIMSSYPRSGNTLLRGYLERVMGLVTGSDCDITRYLNRELMEMGLAGEGLTDKRVWVVKSHFPERFGNTKFGCERVILLVRNPLDCITSLFHMINTGSHDLSIAEECFGTFPIIWNKYIEQEISVWKEFHDFWLSSDVPVHIIRYEDINMRPHYALTELMKFILNVDSIEGTCIEKYIDLGVKEKAPEVYKPRKGAVGRNNEKYSPAQLLYMTLHAGELLKKFNYLDFMVPKLDEVPPFDITWIE